MNANAKIIAMLLVFILISAAASAMLKNTEESTSTIGNDIEIQYCQGVKFYVLVDSNGEPVDFIKQ